ncbi:T9SS-dependent choice-of-anchor J family protein [Altibacter sp. HG106]|uniref:T9SS-dependent choice-of-anchor J family protein n=1 Tax=Altibacter sp. HG106 TaxID=3023937 RepID=UPI00234FF2BD|nr:choice-of-anchor J domain-containing protein [Altibacter sp. HG106]MDC7994407.1 choice-of-anchor J domain-containing protein [Altibacter sp. HG106]
MKKITFLAALFAVFTMNAQTTVWEEGFESYDDFAISGIGGFSQIDNDGDSTYGSADYDFTNEGYTGTGIVFNPSATTPPATGTAWDARTGDKGLYFVAATGDVSGAPQNDDYFITPAINLTGASGGTSFTMWAKSVTDAFGLERFEVLLSTTGTAQADFTEDLTGGVQEAPLDYTEYTFDISAYEGEVVYIALHYLGSDSFVLQTDDWSVEATTFGVEDNVFQNFTHSVTATDLELRSGAPMSNVVLFNVLGQQVVSQKLSTSSETVSISALNAGVYIANVTIEGQTKSFKIVKR